MARKRIRKIYTNLDDIDIQFLRTEEGQLLVELYLAYLDARKNGKRKTYDEQSFEVDEMLNLLILCTKVLKKTYTPSRGVAHIIHNPVIREIFAAPFVDRIVHHWIYMKIYGWWDKHFIFDSYSCREGKGTLMGIQRLDLMIRRASGNFAIPVWVVKMDIQGYFMSINRKNLYERVIWGLDKQYEGRKHTLEYELLKYLIGKIIFDDPVKGVKRRGWPDAWRKLPKSKSLFFQAAGYGIVIGNLTSQLFSNILLDQLDRFVKFTLGYKYYGRYVDDFYIVVNAEQLKHLKRDVEAIRAFLRRLGLTLHPNKFYIQRIERGTQFLGGVVYPGHIQPSERLKRNYRKALRKYAQGKLPVESIVSYRGHVVHLSHKEFEAKLYREVGWTEQGKRNKHRGRRGGR